MNFGFGENFIKKYETTNENKIVIYYLNGDKKEIPLSRENELELLAQMTEEAEKREDVYKNHSKKSIMRSRNSAILWLSIMTNNIAINGTRLAENTEHKTLAMTLLGACFICISFYGYEFYISNKQIKEIEKYSIYLSIKDKIEDSKNSMFYGKDTFAHDLNINTLDNYSLSQIKKLQKKYSNPRK